MSKKFQPIKILWNFDNNLTIKSPISMSFTSLVAAGLWSIPLFCIYNTVQVSYQAASFGICDHGL